MRLIRPLWWACPLPAARCPLPAARTTMRLTQPDLPASKRVIVLLLPHVNMLDMAGPVQVFHSATALGAPYVLDYCSPHDEIISAQGVVFSRLQPLPRAQPGDSILIPGLDLREYARGDVRLHHTVLNWIKQASVTGARILSVCTGAFVLGECGLLDNRRCTTHWSALDALKSRYPNAKVLDGVLYVHDGQITMSAGIAAGIDMALSVVEQDCGPLFVAQVARQMVIYIRRDGSHTQTSAFVQYRTHLHSGVHRAQDFLTEHLTESVSLDQLASAAQMSVRSLSRSFRTATGLTPVQYQQRLRLELAATLLENPSLSVEDIALGAGFADVRHFRRLWLRQYGDQPSRRRQRPTGD